MDIINPTTEAVITQIEADSLEIIQAVYTTTQQAQLAWAAQPLASRMSIIRSFYDGLARQADHLADTLTQEMGKPLSQARSEVNGARRRIAFFLEEVEKWSADEWMTEEDLLGEKISYEPLGVIGNISAWNYPFLVGVNVFVPALLTGNAVLYKPSEYSTLTGLNLEELLHDAGLPRSVFQLVSGGPEAGKALLNLPLDGYFFTGSYATGQHIVQQVAPKMVPCQLELGGKDPLYVTADISDLESVVQSAVEGAFYNNGQSCCAVERIYVHASYYEEFVELFVEEVKKLRVGDPRDKGTFIGPLVRKEQVDFLRKQVGDALIKGASIAYGQDHWEGKGYFFLPTVLVDVNHQMSIMKDESFGPLIGIMSVANDTEAVQLMQDTPYGLTASVYADHYATAEPILKALNTGTVYWNCCDRVSPKLPWSGRKHSGIGTTLSYQGIRAFLKPKAYHLRGPWRS